MDEQKEIEVGIPEVENNPGEGITEVAPSESELEESGDEGEV